jgi:RNA polymerase sigma factor (sigma-70 family)
VKLLINQSELWDLAAGGNQDAYALLHKDLYPSLYHFLLKMVKEEELADDLLQDVFFKIWTKRAQIGAIKNVKAYFFTAARSTAINHFRQRKLIAERLARFPAPEMEFNREDIIIADENNAELKLAMAVALNNLPARQREILYLKFYEDMDYSKIADVTGIKYQSVVNHVFRAIQTLRSVFKQQECFLQLV